MSSQTPPVLPQTHDDAEEKLAWRNYSGVKIELSARDYWKLHESRENDYIIFHSSLSRRMKKAGGNYMLAKRFLLRMEKSQYQQGGPDKRILVIGTEPEDLSKMERVLKLRIPPSLGLDREARVEGILEALHQFSLTMIHRVSEKTWRHHYSTIAQEVRKKLRGRASFGSVKSKRMTPNRIIFNVPCIENAKAILRYPPGDWNFLGLDFELKPWNHDCAHKLCYRCWTYGCVPHHCGGIDGKELRPRVCGCCGALDHDIDNCKIKRVTNVLQDNNENIDRYAAEKYCTNCGSTGHGPKDYRTCKEPVVQAMWKRMDGERYSPEWYRHLDISALPSEPVERPKKTDNTSRFANRVKRPTNSVSQSASSLNSSFGLSMQGTNTYNSAPSNSRNNIMAAFSRISDRTVSDGFQVGPLAQDDVPGSLSPPWVMDSPPVNLSPSLPDRQVTSQDVFDGIDHVSETESESSEQLFDQVRAVSPVETTQGPKSTTSSGELTDMDDEEIIRLGAASSSRTVASPRSRKRPLLDFDHSDEDRNQYRKRRFVVTGARNTPGGYGLRGLGARKLGSL